MENDRPYGDDELMNMLDRALGMRIQRRNALQKELRQLDTEIAVLRPLEATGLTQWKDRYAHQTNDGTNPDE